MRRREFVTVFGAAAATWPLAARAQQPALPIIGWLHGANPDAYAPMATAFRKSLNQSGYFETQNVKIEYRFANDASQLPLLAEEMAALACRIQQAVREKFGVLLKPEAQFVGFSENPLK